MTPPNGYGNQSQPSLQPPRISPGTHRRKDQKSPEECVLCCRQGEEEELPWGGARKITELVLFYFPCRAKAFIFREKGNRTLANTHFSWEKGTKRKILLLEKILTDATFSKMMEVNVTGDTYYHRCPLIGCPKGAPHLCGILLVMLQLSLIVRKHQTNPVEGQSIK